MKMTISHDRRMIWNRKNMKNKTKKWKNKFLGPDSVCGCKILIRLELGSSAILDYVEEGIQAAIDAGVFACPGTSLQQQVPSWKSISYQRVLHRFGLANRFAHWHWYTLDRDDGSWAPPKRPVQPQEVLLNASTPLPESIPIIRAQWAAESIRNLGKVHCSSIDWDCSWWPSCSWLAEGCLLL
jgi:hypothetical protein